MADLDPSLVRAEVVDLRDRRHARPAQVVVDTNVLYFVFYPGFPALAHAGGRGPQHYQTQTYPAWWKQAAKAGTKLFISAASLSEFVTLAEATELEAMWLTDPNRPANSSFSRKDARYQYASQLANNRQGVLTLVQQIQKSVDVLPAFRDPDNGLSRISAVWQSSLTDFNDAAMVANANYGSIPHILTDDIDLVTIAGIRVYTANDRAIRAATAAGTLVPTK